MMRTCECAESQMLDKGRHCFGCGVTGRSRPYGGVLGVLLTLLVAVGAQAAMTQVSFERQVHGATVTLVQVDKRHYEVTVQGCVTISTVGFERNGVVTRASFERACALAANPDSEAMARGVAEILHR